MATTTDKYVLDAKMNAKDAINNSNNLTGNLKQMAVQTIKTVVAFQTLKKGIEFFTKSVKMAMEQQDIYIDLATSVELTGKSFEDAENSLKGLFSELQATTEYGDTDSAKMLNNLIDLTGDYETSVKHLPLVLDMASTSLFSAESASRYLGMALAGNIEMLGRYIPELKASNNEQLKTMTTAEKTAYAMELLQSKFGGTASKQMDSTTKQLTQMLNYWGDIRESIGDFYIPILNKAIKLTDKLLHMGIAEEKEKYANQRKYREQLNKMTIDEIEAIEYQQKFEMNFLWVKQKSEDKAHKITIANINKEAEKYKGSDGLVWRAVANKIKFENEAWQQKKDNMNEEFILLEKQQKMINDMYESLANKPIKTTMKMEMIDDDSDMDFDWDETLPELPESFALEPTIVISQEEIDNFNRQTQKIQEFINSNLTSAVSGFYDQLLAGKNSIRDWGQFFEGVIKRLIAQMLTLQTLSFFGNMLGMSLGGANIFGSILGKLTGTTSSVLPTGGALASDNGGFDGLISAINSQPIVVNIDPNAFIQSADNVIISQSAEIGTIQRNEVRF